MWTKIMNSKMYKLITITGKNTGYEIEEFAMMSPTEVRIMRKHKQRMMFRFWIFNKFGMVETRQDTLALPMGLFRTLKEVSDPKEFEHLPFFEEMKKGLYTAKFYDEKFSVKELFYAKQLSNGDIKVIRVDIIKVNIEDGNPEHVMGVEEITVVDDTVNEVLKYLEAVDEVEAEEQNE